jgi:DNA-binding NarL/FixJ family response regulator
VTPIRVLLADDHQSVRQGRKALINVQPDSDVPVIRAVAVGRR